MIIQCKQCRTKFRFDDSQIDGDGLWMRCSRCQHVFFQDNPKKTNTAGMPQVSMDSPGPVVPERKASRLTFEPANDAPAPGLTAPDDDVASFLQDVMATEKTADDKSKPQFRAMDRARADIPDIDFSPGFEDLDELHEPEETSEEEPALPARRKNRIWMVALWTILVIIVIPAVVYFVIFPQLGDRYLKLGEQGLNVVLNAVGISRPMEGQSVTRQVRLQDVRQRIINNYILGNIRVVEGNAVNGADFSVARVLVKGQILDAYAVVLGERASYAGNVLTDEDLTNLSEEEILKRLTQPAGRDNSNERVIPNGQLPFMIVFTREPPGVIKTTVTITGAERLL